MSSNAFQLTSSFSPQGDQPTAIDALVSGLAEKKKHQVLLGITGSGKTFTVACVIQKVQRPTLVIAHNKTLAAQLYSEFRQLFPQNAVHYFVSYYDYYQPEAYVPSSDTYIEKDALINDEIDRMRHAATRALLSRRDVIIVASVSCIYGIGSSESYYNMMIELHRGQPCDRDDLLKRLVEIQYERNDYDFHRGTFRVRGDIVEVFPVHEDERAIRLQFFGDELEALWEIDPLRGKVLTASDHATIYPSSHYVTPDDLRQQALERIKVELQERLQSLHENSLLVEAQRLEQRTMFDIEMLEQMGYCTGIENYSRHLTGRSQGEPPPTLIDYFPDDYLLVIDESHQTIPQLQAMYRGDRSRKETLVTYGFRLPSALDNRPLRFDEFEKAVRQVIYVSATPGDYELQQTAGEIVEQVIRPTGLLDPKIEVRPVTHQVEDLLGEIRIRVEKKQRVLVTTLTKRMAEDLSEYYKDLGVKVRYLHSDIDTLERVEIIRDLRHGVFDVLIGINLLREGLNLPEVALVAIFDADKEGFLRSTRSLIQTIGRAARNVDASVIMYADTITESMRRAIDETNRRRELQERHNRLHGITPQTVQSETLDLAEDRESDTSARTESRVETATNLDLSSIPETIASLKQQMYDAAQTLDFERAAMLRDQIRQLNELELTVREPTILPTVLSDRIAELPSKSAFSKRTLPEKRKRGR